MLLSDMDLERSLDMKGGHKTGESRSGEGTRKGGQRGQIQERKKLNKKKIKYKGENESVGAFFDKK